MAVLTKRPAAQISKPTVEKTETAVLEDIEYRGNTVDTRYVDHTSLLTHVSGSSWTVRYFQQYLGADNEPTAQDVFKSAVYQQYKLIENLEIKVTSPLSSSEDSESKEFEVTGEATMYPPLIPNKGDMFLADIGDGREGIFSITQVTRMSILKDTTYSISYVLIDFSTEQRRKDLEAKVIKETHFDKRLLSHGMDPVIVSDEYNRRAILEKQQHVLLDTYLTQFYNKSIASLAVPDQTMITYDGFLVNTIKALFESDEHPLLRQIKTYSTDIANIPEPKTIWDCMLRMSDALRPLISEQLGLFDSKLFNRLSTTNGLYYSNVRDVVFPTDRDIDFINRSTLKNNDQGIRDIRHQFTNTNLGSLLRPATTGGTGIAALPPIKPVVEDTYYVFTEAFYTKQKEQMSQLELLVEHLLTAKQINQKVLSELVDMNQRWSLIDRFYYTPVLLILIKASLRGF